MKTLEEKIAVMNAFKEGKTISYYTVTGWVITKHPKWNWDDTDYKVVEEPPKKRMTNGQFIEWLSKGNGIWKYADGHIASNSIPFDDRNFNEEVVEDKVIRPWGSDEWVSPTVDIYERDCRGE